MCNCLRSKYIAVAALMFAAALHAQEPAEDVALRTPEIVANPEAKLLDEEGAGKLYQIGEHLLCILQGTHREMGLQHGRLLAERIRQIMKEGYMVSALLDRGYTKDYIKAQSERMQKHFLPFLENRVMTGDHRPEGDT